jgi:DNA-binding transcriptional LysR family regulator
MVGVKHLRAFVAVARLGSFTRASEQLRLSQPALTIIVRQLETEVGVTLFDRTTRRVELSPDGEQFVLMAERLLQDFDAAIMDLRAVADRRRGRISVAAVPSVASRLLPAAISKFAAAFPGITIQLHDGNSSDVQRRVRRSEVDFGFASIETDDPDLDRTPLFQDTLGVICKAGHPLTRKRHPLRWSDLAGYPFLGLGHDTGIQPLLAGVPDLPHELISPQYQISHSITYHAMLEAGVGITVLPQIAIPPIYEKALRFIPLTEPTVTRQICLLQRRGRSLSRAAETIREEIVTHIQKTMGAVKAA